MIKLKYLLSIIFIIGVLLFSLCYFGFIAGTANGLDSAKDKCLWCGVDGVTDSGTLEGTSIEEMYILVRGQKLYIKNKQNIDLKACQREGKEIAFQGSIQQYPFDDRYYITSIDYLTIEDFRYPAHWCYISKE